MITQEELKSLLKYDPETGILIWIKSNCNRISSGSEAGWLDKNGNIYITINNISYSSHNIVWLYLYGYYPSHMVVRKNGVKSDNRKINLCKAKQKKSKHTVFGYDHIIKLFNYDEKTGVLTRLVTQSHNAKKGDIVGSIKKENHTSYLNVRIMGRAYGVHRIIWLYMTGVWPDQIDHIDHNGLNNKWNNLRSVTNKQNSNNRSSFTKIKSGVQGVYWNKLVKKWIVIIYLNEKNKYLGSFSDLSQAIKVRSNAAQKSR